MIVYDKLWDTLKEKGISQYKLIHEYGISPAQITRLKRNNNVSTHTLDVLCTILNCSLTEIAEYKPTEECQKELAGRLSAYATQLFENNTKNTNDKPQ